MSKMLVAYEECGCRAMALLVDNDDGLAASFRVDAELDGLEVREEEHEAVGVAPCGQHAGPQRID